MRKCAPLLLIVALAPAYAQTQQVVSQDQASNSDQEQKEVKSTDEDDVEESEDGELILEEVKVVGLRQSMKKAQQIKMESDSIVDAIVAEDIGKLPDLTAAESLARITGVQVTRFNDEANSVIIRGLPDVTTTYNGREFFTAENRRAALQDFPSQALAGIEVYKSGTADLIEPGLAGLVNVRTRRPFDFDGQKIAGGVHYGYNDQSEKSSPNGNILYSNRWQTSMGDVGILANATYAQSKYYNGVRYNTTWFPDAQPHWNIEEPYSEGGFVLPARVGLYNESGDRWRPSGNIALQWRPNNELEVYFDGIFQGYRGSKTRDNFWFHLTEFDRIYETGDVNLSNITMVPGTNDTQAASLTKSGGHPPEAYRSTEKGRTDTYQYAIGAKWDNGFVQIATDLAYTDSKFSDYHWSFDTGLSFSPTVNANFFGDQGGAVFDSPDWDVTDLSTYVVRGYFESRHEVSGKGLQWRTDFTFDTGWGDWLHTIQTGFRYSDRNAARRSGSRYSWFWDLDIPFSDLTYLDYELTHDPYRSSAQGFTQYLAPTLDSIQNNKDALARLAYESALARDDNNTAALWANPEIAIDPASNWLAEEQTYAIYLQTKSHFELGSVGIDLFAGVRVVQTDSENRGTSIVNFNDQRRLERRSRDNSYVDVLPNLSVRAMITDKLQWRAGVTKTRTKPGFGALNPALNITQVAQPDVVDPNAPPLEFDAVGSGGNPNLKPLTSDNYDMSLEYYFSDTGFVSGAVFYRDLFGFTENYTRFIEDPDYGTVKLSTPENAGEGKLKGWEVNASTFLDYDFVPEFLKPFGVSANLTKLEGKNRLPDGDGNFGDFVDIQGISKYTYNAAVFYEDNRFSARLSYNNRETWVNWYGDTSQGKFAGNKTRTRDRLDFSSSYDVNDNFSIYADVANILARPFRNFTVIEGLQYTQDVRDEGRYFGVGLRYSY